MTSNMSFVERQRLKDEIAELQRALEDAADGGQQTRLRLAIASRQAQLRAMRRATP